MLKFESFLGIWICYIAFSNFSHADIKIPGLNVETVDIIFTDTEASTAQPLIIGGYPSDPKNWPSTKYFESVPGQCTATFIGPSTVITAAHCILDNYVATVKNQEHVRLGCRTHPKYFSDTTTRNASNYDIAMCTGKDIVAPAYGGRYERLELMKNRVSVKDKITLIGYGCRKYYGGGPTGELFEGKATVRFIEEQEIVTLGGAAVCYGDSGGSAFKTTSSSRRSIIAINKRGDIVERSYLTYLANRSISDFIHAFIQTNDAEVCGVNYVSDDCVQAP